MPAIRIDTPQGPVDLDYVEQGEGHPVLLVHGFASTKEVNWVNTGWLRKLARAGFRAIAFDNRGHGASTKFYRKEAYSLDIMADDAAAFAEAIGLERPHVIGYSMGARIACMLAIAHGDRLGRIVVSGNGWNMVEDDSDWSAVEDGLRAPSLAEVTDRRAREFRAFADQTGGDLKALAACVSGVRQRVPEAGLRAVENEVLVAVGTDDDIAGSGERLAEIMPHGRFFAIEGRDHMKAVGDRSHVAEAVAFLSA